jgi:hypothetical protein
MGKTFCKVIPKEKYARTGKSELSAALKNAGNPGRLRSRYTKKAGVPKNSSRKFRKQI